MPMPTFPIPTFLPHPSSYPKIRLISLYLAAIVLANLTTSWWGPRWSKWTSGVPRALEVAGEDPIGHIRPRALGSERTGRVDGRRTSPPTLNGELFPQPHRNDAGD